ncbi:MAG TPA: hypothetical protein VFZ65_21170 [Planctomycetota bacterium]|nr:hypothetical protein [Planctomycetota bacterium]
MTQAAATPSTRPRSRRRRLLFAMVPVTGLLLLGELVCRVTRHPFYFGSFRDKRTDLMARNYPAERDPMLGYVPKPGFASRDNHWRTLVSIDADGMRRNGRTPPPGGGLVAAVGDSFTFGDQVDDDATWPAQLEVALDRPVKNGGVFGYSLTQSVLRAEAMLDRFDVAALVVSFIPDDLTRCEYSKRYTPVPWFDLDGDGIVLRGVPIDPSAPPDSTKRWKDTLGYSALVDTVLANTVRDWWCENEKQVPVSHLLGRGPEIGKYLVERIAARCRACGTRLLLLLQGDVPTEQACGVLHHAEALGVETLDLATRFVAEKRRDPSLEDRYFAGHMTREGNRWVADAVAERLRAAK